MPGENAFFDHMLDGFARHGLFDLEVKVDGDLEVDSHHTIEDVGIVLGTIFAGTMTSSPGPTPRASMARCKAEVPLFTPLAYRLPT